PEGLVERREVLGVPEHDAHVHDVREIQSRSRQDVPEVLERLPRLLADVGAHDLARAGIERPLARYEEQVSGPNRLRERRGRSLVGEAGGGRRLRGDDLLGHGRYSNAALISAGMGIAFSRPGSSGRGTAQTRTS